MLSLQLQLRRAPYTLAATKITPSIATWTKNLVVVTPSKDASLHVAIWIIGMPVYSIIQNVFVAMTTERMAAQTIAIHPVMTVGVHAVEVGQIPFTSLARLLSLRQVKPWHPRGLLRPQLPHHWNRLPHPLSLLLLKTYTLAATKITPILATWTVILVVVSPSKDASLNAAVWIIGMPVYSIIRNAFVAANTERISAQTPPHAMHPVMTVGVHAVDLGQIPFTSLTRLLSLRQVPLVLVLTYTLAATKITPSLATWTKNLVVVTPSKNASLHVAI
jgi:hypothetical protein